MLKVLALVLAGQLADGGTRDRPVIEVETGTLSSVDGGVHLVVGGCYLDNYGCLSVGDELASLRAKNKKLTQSTEDLKASPVNFTVGVIVGATAAAIITYGVMSLIQSAQK